MLEFKEIIRLGCENWGLAVSDAALDRMERFSDLLIEKNRVMNLTAVTEPPEIARRHMLDSLFLLTCANFSGANTLDVGSGAGFPSVPLLCYDPAFQITPLDSTGKRMDFVRDACCAMGISVSPVTGRAEELARGPLRASFDLVVSRAVAPLNVLAELCLPFVRVGGSFLAMKTGGPEGETELREAEKAFAMLGGQFEDAPEYHIDGVEKPRQVLRIRKTRLTPEKYPRRYSKITDKPL
ncbi:MAG: 16S rRNA (guanine(527)-N(7))-methyltransferase RsmG [Clostridiaceae bacterium]|nr:16S rRNA (guanine(527)-N(7))-methyltransferase RsmG [Clostridiaceae bacterium]